MSSIDICKKNWRKMLVGEPEAIKSGDGDITSRIASCNRAAIRAWEDYKSKGGPNRIGFFRDTPAEKSNDMTQEYIVLRRMALGYATYGTDCYQSPELLADLLGALEWGYNHYYGVAEMEGRGWRSTGEFNWWDWQIGTSSALMDIMVLIDEHLTLEQKRNYLALFDKLVPAPRDYGANKVNYGRLIAQSGILCERPERVFCGRDGIEDTYLYADGGVNDGQGFYRDGSYVFHTRHAMNFTYGIEHFTKLIDMASIIAGSEFQLKKEHSDLLYTWLYKSFVPFCRKGEVFRSVLGRHPGGVRGLACNFIRDLVRLYALSEDDKKDELALLITMLFDEHPLTENGTCNEIFGAFTLNDYLVFKEAYLPTGATVERNGLYAFNCIDRAVQHTEDYCFSLSISSSRIYNYECINHQNMNGWYHGDGMLCLHSSPFKYCAEYWAGIDPYRIPGTTADDRERAIVTISQANEYLSSKDFVGTLTTGNTGVSVMQLESYHGDGELKSTRFYRPDGSYGGPAPARECTLTANKAYFFMDGYAVCLGSAVNAHDGARVYTTVENRHGDPIIQGGKVVGYSPLGVTFNGKAVDVPTADTVYEGVDCITLGSDAYCILDGSSVIAKKREGDIDFTQIVLDHGIDPVDGSYAYAVLPLTSPDGAKRFMADLPFEIVENSSAAQVIREKATGDLYCVFHGKGEAAGIAVETPILCAVKGGTLYACDVTQKLGKVSVSVNGKNYEFDFTDMLGKVQEIEL